jgi:hypothetical protein
MLALQPPLASAVMRCLKLADQREVLLHVSGQYKVDHCFANSAPSRPVEAQDGSWACQGKQTRLGLQHAWFAQHVVFCDLEVMQHCRHDAALLNQ